MYDDVKIENKLEYTLYIHYTATLVGFYARVPNFIGKQWNVVWN